MILAGDIGYNNYGCSIIDDQGQVVDVGTIVTRKTKKKLLRVADDDVQRITHITAKLSALVKRYNILGVVAELPPSNSQSALAARALATAVAITVALFTELKIPVEWATPEEVKKALTGKANASKEDMMLAACKKYNWKITEKNIYNTKTNKIKRVDKTYYPLGRPMGKNKFEHIADSLGAYEALKNTTTVRIIRMITMTQRRD